MSFVGADSLAYVVLFHQLVSLDIVVKSSLFAIREFGVAKPQRFVRVGYQPRKAVILLFIFIPTVTYPPSCWQIMQKYSGFEKGQCDGMLRGYKKARHGSRVWFHLQQLFTDARYWLRNCIRLLNSVLPCSRLAIIEVLRS